MHSPDNENEFDQIQKYRDNHNIESSIKSIQQCYRSYQLMKASRASFLTLRTAAKKTQQRFRATKEMRMERRKYVALRNAVILIQRRFRAMKTMRIERAKYVTLKNAATLIQMRYRTLRSIRSIRKEKHRLVALLQIQRRFRATKKMMTERKKYLALRHATVLCQRKYRSFQLTKILREKFLTLRKATIFVQRSFRAKALARFQRLKYLRIKSAVGTIQATYRAQLLMKKTRLDYIQLRKAAIETQKRYRATLLMKKLSNRYKLIRCAIIRIQCRWRATIAMRRERRKFLQSRRAAIFIQQKYRGHQQMLVDREHFRKIIDTRQQAYESIRNMCAVTIQAMWRGWAVRSRKTDRSKIMKKIRLKMERVGTNVQQDKVIENLLREHVAVLTNKNSFRDLLHALRAIAKMSRTVPNALNEHSTFLSNFCYEKMSQARRSETDKLLIEQCSSIILNMARCNETKKNTFKLNGLTAISQVLMRWCDKSCDIFNTLCTVIYVFSLTPQFNQQMRDYFKNDQAVYMFDAIKRRIIRKENMTKNKIEKSSSTRTLVSLKIQEPNELPSRKSDFGMLSRRPYIFSSSVFAYDTVVNELYFK